MNHFLLTTIIISISIAIVYIIIALVKKKMQTNSLTEVFSVIISAGSLVSGIKLIVTTFQRAYVLKPETELEGTDFYYTIIGGIAVAWLAISELLKRFKDLSK